MLNQDPQVPPWNTAWRYHPQPWARWRNQLGNKLLVTLAQPITQLVDRYRQQWQLPPFRQPNDAYSSLAQLCQQPAEFEFPRQSLPACFHFTGPYSNPASREPTTFPFAQLLHWGRCKISCSVCSRRSRRPVKTWMSSW
jgi:zeaxanthin glucosyltransferase